MNSEQHALSSEVIADKLNRMYGSSTYSNEEEAITNLAFELLMDSQVYKQNRMNRVALFERLYNNELPRKERQLFNICLPIFGGFEDALQANLTDPVKLKFEETNPQDYLVIPKIQAQFDAEKDGLLPHQMWNSKARDLMHDGLLSGRMTGKIYAENWPSYRSIFETTNYTDFHCQPLGGGYLENHLFAGEEGIYMTVEDIVSNDAFPKSQRDKIANFNITDEFWQTIEQTYGTRFARFKSMYLNAQSNTFSGAKTVYLAQFVVTRKGVRYYVLFDPISKIWLQCEKLSDFTGTDLYPWKSSATHQDSKNFWSKGFSDDIFAVALTVSTLLNQELTNREKSNFNARAYDPTMFTDEAKLDAAQYIPDRLVPADTMGGTKRIADGIFSFETAQLSGTIDLVQWMQSNISGTIGLSDLTQPGPGTKGSKGRVNAAVQIAQQQQLSKRLGFRSEPVKEMFGQIGEAYVQGLKEFMPGSLKIRIIGEDGFAEESELKRIEMSRTGSIGVKVISTTSEDADNQAKKSSRTQVLGLVAQDPNVSSIWRTESTLKDVGGYSDEEIKIAMNTQSPNARKQIAHASLAIQELLKGKVPKIYYGAETTFLEHIQDFVIENENKVMKRKVHPEHGVEVHLIALFNEYMQTMAPICQKNDQRAVKKTAQQASPMAGIAGKSSGVTQPGGKPMPGLSSPQMA